MQISITRKNTYGQERIYVVDKNQQHAIQTLTGKTTIDSRDIKALQSLGFTVQEVTVLSR